MQPRAVLFIDGNNWFHGMGDIGVPDRARLNYKTISEKLTHPRDWIETRYYIGQVSQERNTRLYADQRRFLSRIRNQDSRISVHLGRLEPRQSDNEAAREIQSYLANLPTRIDTGVYRELIRIASEHRNATIMVEKAVDVMVAVDMVTMAQRDQLDVAYLLSADGDFTPAVEAVKDCKKKIFAVSPLNGHQLAQSVDSFIRIGGEWFDDCYES